MQRQLEAIKRLKQQEAMKSATGMLVDKQKQLQQEQQKQQTLKEQQREQHEREEREQQEAERLREKQEQEELNKEVQVRCPEYLYSPTWKVDINPGMKT